MKPRPQKAVILTQMPVLAAGLGDMLRAEGFELMLHPGAPNDFLGSLPSGERLLVIVHGESEADVQRATALYRKSPASIFVLWAKKITLSGALEALESGASAVLSTRLSVETTKSTLLQICDGEECQIRIPGDAVSRHRKVPRLTAREKQILQLVKAAASNKEIAHELQLREGTIKVYLNKLFRKLGVRSRLELAQWMPESREEGGNGHELNPVEMPLAGLATVNATRRAGLLTFGF